MGGSGSHQFTVPCENGEDIIVYTEDNRLAWNIEKAPVDPLPKTKAPADIAPPEEVHTPNVGTIEAVCEFLKTKPQEMIKTLVYSMGEQTVGAILRGDHELNPEKLTQAVDGKHIELADEAAIEKATSAAVGFAGPMSLADKVDLMLIDHAVAAMALGVTGANKTDYHTKNVVPGRDFPLQGDNIRVVDIRNAVEGDSYDGKKLLFKHGIEVGQVFKLGTKYSTKLDANFLDADGVEKPCLMGCYGIGINRIMASAIELGNDKDGIIWPISIAPWEVIITPAVTDDDITPAVEKIYTDLKARGVDVIIDDRDVRAGVKFKDADLLGIPVRVTLGKKSFANGNAELKLRTESEAKNIPLETITDEVVNTINALKQKLNSND
jgi:prolyl-tRNA synthetase